MSEFTAIKQQINNQNRNHGDTSYSETVLYLCGAVFIVYAVLSRLSYDVISDIRRGIERRYSQNTDYYGSEHITWNN